MFEEYEIKLMVEKFGLPTNLKIQNLNFVFEYGTNNVNIHFNFELGQHTKHNLSKCEGVTHVFTNDGRYNINIYIGKAFEMKEVLPKLIYTVLNN